MQYVGYGQCFQAQFTRCPTAVVGDASQCAIMHICAWGGEIKNKGFFRFQLIFCGALTSLLAGKRIK
jgi:hypothetical protein